jgi:serine/threonine protein kinase
MNLGAIPFICGCGDDSPTVPMTQKLKSLKDLKSTLNKQTRVINDRKAVKVYLGDALLHDFLIDKALGRGGQGGVYAVTNLLDNQPVAMKRIQVRTMNDLVLAKREVNNIRDLDHKGVVKVYTSFQNICHNKKEYDLYYTMQIYEKGDLNCLIAKYKKEKMKFSQVQLINALYQLSDALAYIHQKNVIHRDLKPENIYLLNWNPIELVIGDFGLSKIIPNATRAHSICGTVNYIAPEVFHHEPYGFSADMFSLGCVMVSMMTLSSNRSIAQDLKRYDEKTVLKQLQIELSQSGRYEKEFIQCILLLLRVDATLRPAAKFIKRFCQMKLDQKNLRVRIALPPKPKITLASPQQETTITTTIVNKNDEYNKVLDEWKRRVQKC